MRPSRTTVQTQTVHFEYDFVRADLCAQCLVVKRFLGKPPQRHRDTEVSSHLNVLRSASAAMKPKLVHC